jgi:hypothetical protein
MAESSGEVPRHIRESINVISVELKEAKRRHPAGACREIEDGWTRVHPNVIYFEHRQAG